MDYLVAVAILAAFGYLVYYNVKRARANTAEGRQAERPRDGEVK